MAGMGLHNDEKGMTFFEIAIILLILALVSFSCYYVTHKINEAQHNSADRLNQFHTIDGTRK
jgi:hypothetical protein